MRKVIGGDDCVWLDIEERLRETDKAVLFKIHGEDRWVPKSVIVDEGDEVVGVAKWWASKNNIDSDW